MRENIFGVSWQDMCAHMTEAFGSQTAEERAHIVLSRFFKPFIKESRRERDLSLPVERWVQENFVAEPSLSIVSTHKSEIDGSIKIISSLNRNPNLRIESVLIPEKSRLTLCVSSQVGCAQKCRFCRTGQMGLLESLKAHEIVSQVLISYSLFREDSDYVAYDKVTNIVFMGMGEPLDNFDEVHKAIQIFSYSRGLRISPKKMTLSTVGLIPELKRALEETEALIALSIHSPYEEERSRLMPVNIKYPLTEIVAVLREYHERKGDRQFFIQYTLIQGVNDSASHAHALAELFKGLSIKINLIPLNEHRGTRYRRPSLDHVYTFQKILKGLQLIATIRLSKGRDINAACGQLVNA